MSSTNGRWLRPGGARRPGADCTRTATTCCTDSSTATPCSPQPHPPRRHPTTPCNGSARKLQPPTGARIMTDYDDPPPDHDDAHRRGHEPPPARHRSVDHGLEPRRPIGAVTSSTGGHPDRYRRASGVGERCGRGWSGSRSATGSPNPSSRSAGASTGSSSRNSPPCTSRTPPRSTRTDTGFGPIGWHERLSLALPRLSRAYSGGCARGHDPLKPRSWTAVVDEQEWDAWTNQAHAH